MAATAQSHGRPPASSSRCRAAVRVALRAAVTGAAQDAAALEVINRASARAPRSPIAAWRPDADPVAATDYHGASRADVAIGALASDASRCSPVPNVAISERVVPRAAS